jgi:hypothetical protein
MTRQAQRAVLLAVLLLALTLFALANFVLVDIHLLGLSLRLRLAWVAVVPGLIAFGLGILYARLRD